MIGSIQPIDRCGIVRISAFAFLLCSMSFLRPKFICIISDDTAVEAGVYVGLQQLMYRL